jgi:hypothetical protein
VNGANPAKAYSPAALSRVHASLQVNVKNQGSLAELECAAHLATAKVGVTQQVNPAIWRPAYVSQVRTCAMMVLTMMPMSWSTAKTQTVQRILYARTVTQTALSLRYAIRALRYAAMDLMMIVTISRTVKTPPATRFWA